MSVRTIFFLCLVILSGKIVESSRITISNGLYNNILVAIHPNTESRNCAGLLQSITEAFQYTSSQLNVVTNGKVSFGSIKILIPSNWGTLCENLPIENVTSTISLLDVYDNADFKLTSTHPFASKLPWTKQYKGCENESESIYVPMGFFETLDFDSETKGKLLMAEWAKFRYGIFEEHGYLDDPLFPVCYILNGKILYTGCTTTPLNPLSNSTTNTTISSTDCSRLIKQKIKTLGEEMKSLNNSVLLTPHLQNMENFCTRDSQIGLSPTKQNVLCERKSATDVIFSHNDFSIQRFDSYGVELFPNTRNIQRPGSGRIIVPQISLIRRDGNFDQGYAFILEDDSSMRNFRRLQYVKQGIAQILQLIKPRTHIAVFRFEGSDYSQFFWKVNNDLDKIQVLGKIPEYETSSLSEYISARYGRSRSNLIQFPDSNNKKRKSLLKILNILSGYKSEQWHLILITSSSPGDLITSLPELQNSPHVLSVVTFDDSKEWLQFNTIPNIKKVLFFPSCIETPMNCRTSSLLVDYFTEILSTNSSTLHHYTHKVVDFTFSGGFENSFNISEENYVSDLKDFQLFLPTYTTEPSVQIFSPSGQNCGVSKLLNYNYVIEFDTSVESGCHYQIGQWRIRVTGPDGAELYKYTLYGVGETDENSASNLMTSVSLGKKLDHQIFPTVGSLPVYVSVSNKLEQPVINADVTLKIFYENQNLAKPNLLQLQDNGVDPDLLENDGVYSAFITDFNQSPAYHTGQVSIKTTNHKTQRIVSLNYPNDTILLDPRTTSKCCGSKLSLQVADYVGTATYSVLLPSFRTGEGIDPQADIFPPSRIQSQIDVVDDTLNEIELEFTAPGADYNIGAVDHYDICCTNSTNGNLDESLCISIEDSGQQLCKPVLNGMIQNCRIKKNQLVNEFFNDSQPGFPLVPLYCSLRGVDKAKNFGPLSFTMVEVKVDPGKVINEQTVECKQISDGCLPVDIFWALIGCIAGLVFILFVVVFCWCCLARQETKALKRRRKQQQPNSSNWIDGLSHESLNNVYINQAYIQDANGHLKLVASDGVLHCLDSPPTTEVEFSPVRSKSVPVLNNDKSDTKHTSWSSDSTVENITKTNNILQLNSDRPPSSVRSFSPPPSLPLAHSRRPAPTASTSHQMPIRVDLSSDISPHTIQSISSDVDSTGPVYASVSRFGRKGTSPNNLTNQDEITPSRNIPKGVELQRLPILYSTVSVLPEMQSVTESHPNHLLSSLPEAFVVTPPGVISDAKFNRNRLRPLPPVRLDHFPSSESEVYSDISYIVRNPNERSKSPPQSKNSNKVPNGNKMLDQSMRTVSFPERIHEAPEPFQDSPKKKIIPQHRSMEIQRPSAFPPPPPRQHTKAEAAETKYKKEVRRSREELDDDGYVDNSDNWDNYDDDDDVKFHFKYNTGASYA